MKIYLCGPINGCTDAECNDWRSGAKSHFSETIDPMRRDYRGRESECVDEIVELDKVDVEECDVVLANCPKPSVGTSMEVFYAHQLGKVVVSIVPKKVKASPWLIYHSTVLVESMAEAVAFIESNEHGRKHF
jgi:nucleoside 2-deoxyribosyltransferase